LAGIPTGAERTVSATQRSPARSATTQQAPATRRVRASRLDEHAMLELIGSLDQIPFVAIEPARIRAIPFDHRAGFVLAQVDGLSTLEAILDVCGMTRLEALRLLFQLLERRVIRLAPR
jgi:hypothetical protein